MVPPENKNIQLFTPTHNGSMVILFDIYIYIYIYIHIYIYISTVGENVVSSRKNVFVKDSMLKRKENVIFIYFAFLINK